MIHPLYISQKEKKAAFILFVIFIPIVFFIMPGKATAQTTLKEYIDSASINNPQLITLQNQIEIFKLGKKSMKAIYSAPKGYISSDINIVPYFNNKGGLFTTNPSVNAVGYDIGITNGGLYSALFNVDFPVFSKKKTHNALFWQNQQINTLKIRKKNLLLNIDRQVTNLYFTTLGVQLSYLTQKETVRLLSEEVKIMEHLTQKGLYRLVDYELLKTTLSNDSITLKNLENTFHISILKLKSACGIADTTVSLLKTEKIRQNQVNKLSSVFIQPFINDSITAIARDRLFNNRYLPKVMLYSNAGLNAVSLNGIEKKMGVSAGIRLSYTLFDGRQKEVSKEQSLIQINKARQLKQLKSKNLIMQRKSLEKAISEARKNLEQQARLKINYKKLIKLYKIEVQKGQVPITGFLMALRNYNTLKLNYGLQEIKLYQLINEYNYWNN